MKLNNLEFRSQLDTLWKDHRPDHIYGYQNEYGESIGGIARWDAQDGGKTIRLIRKIEGMQESERWEYGAIPEPRPLYRLPGILTRSGATVLIVEGEKTSDAAQKLFPDYVVSTTMGGANAPHKTDFAPLEGRHIILSPDNDEAGETYAQSVINMCQRVNVASIKILSQRIFNTFQIVNGTLIAREGTLPQGYDLADALDEGWTPELVHLAGNQLGELYMDVAVYIEQAVSLNILSETKASQELGSIDDVPFGYTLNTNGLFYEDTWLCSYIKVLALTRDETNKNWGRLIELTDPDGKTHTLTLPMAELAGDSNELIKRLLSLGLRMEGSLKARNKLVNFLQNTALHKRIVCVPKIGWHGEHFVLPNEVVPATDELVLQSGIGEFLGYTTVGSMLEWQEDIALPCKGNSRLLLALSSAFAAPLISLICHENFGFHFKGASSIGKTTALQIATSVWGSPKLQESWKATANALEAVAVSHNDSLICLDELGQADGKDVGEVVYMLANGTGKRRMKAKGDLRDQLTWKTLVLSTGEISIEDKLNEYNRKPQAGMFARLIEIPADTESGHRLFDTIHQYKQSSEFANHLKERTRAYYGSAIRSFLTNIRAYKEHLPQRLETMNDQLLSQFNTVKWGGQEKRVAKHFALVALAGEIAIEMGILPFESTEVFRGTLKCFQSWLTTRGDNGDYELIAGVAQVRRFFEEHHLSRFAWNDKNQLEKFILNLAGYKQKVFTNGEEAGIEFFVYPETFSKEICKGYNAQEILRELHRKGMLKRGNERQFVSEKRLSNRTRMRVYHFLPAILGDIEEDTIGHSIDVSQIYGATGETECYHYKSANQSKGYSVSSCIGQDEHWGDKGDNNPDNILLPQQMSSLSPSQLTTKRTNVNEQNSNRIKGFRYVSPLSPYVTPKNAIHSDLEGLTNAPYLLEERLAIQNDSILEQHK